MNIEAGDGDCICKGLGHPHEQFAPGCLADKDGPFCEECGQPCETHVVDFGIGHYEYWGATGTDTNKQLVSKCCDGDLYKDCELQCTYDYED